MAYCRGKYGKWSCDVLGLVYGVLRNVARLIDKNGKRRYTVITE